jgi:C-terminal processing protease CtpA/Prc
VERLLPFVARDLYKRSIQGHRAKTGIEVAPGVYYVDLDGLSVAGWTALLPTLRHARSIVLDLRGIIAGGAFVSLAHFTDQLLLSPHFEIPLVGKSSVQQPPTQWSIRPAQPRLNVPLVVLCDGQSMSADETFLQIFHDNRLGTIVGEPSGGTNGNVNTFSIPGGFTVRFTGMRVAGSDGTTIQGHGIVPDQVVHPTLEGVRAGRDEILEAGIAAAQRLAPK